MNKDDIRKIKKYCKNNWCTDFKIVSIKSSGLTYFFTTSCNNKPIILKVIKTKSKLKMLKDIGFELEDGIHLDICPGFSQIISISFFGGMKNQNEYFQRFFCEDVFDEID